MKLIKRIKCPVCNFDKTQSIYKLSYKDSKIKNFLEVYYNKKLNLDLIADNNYNLLDCKNCKFIFQEFIPDELFSEHLYENLISATASLKKKDENIKNLKKKYHNEIFLINKIFQGKKINILEFGAGWGFWSLVAKESGFNAVKFQKRTIDKVYSKELLDQLRESPWGTTQRHQKEGLEFNFEQYKEIDDYCKSLKIFSYKSYLP